LPAETNPQAHIPDLATAATEVALKTFPVSVRLSPKKYGDVNAEPSATAAMPLTDARIRYSIAAFIRKNLPAPRLARAASGVMKASKAVEQN
jgi:hypothetical protein